MHLILNLSQNFIVTEFGKLTLFPFKVTLTPFQFISVMSQIGMISYFLVTTTTSFFAVKQDWLLAFLSFMCLHSMYITKIITNSEIITGTNRKKTSIVKLLKKKFFYANLSPYWYTFLSSQTLLFYDYTNEQSLLVSWMLLVSQCQS